jgi:TonB family protein
MAPPPPAAAPPPRVVGISLDATVGAGEGPAFATGDTHLGQTADRAAAPRAAAPAAPPRSAAAARNQSASHLPVGGAQFTPPRRKRPHEPRYPEALKAQEIEADVTVMVAIDDHGTVTSVDVIRPALYPEFNQTAREAARQEEYEPALRDGVPVPDKLSYTYRFRLDTK